MGSNIKTRNIQLIVKYLGIFTSLSLLNACSLTQATSTLRQPITIDGSSTVYPITEKVVADFNQENQGKLQATAGFSGTGGGFRKFCAGEIDITNASRPITQKEMVACKNANIAYIELPIAFDALTVAVNKQNNWADHVTVQELKTMWQPTAQRNINTWKQVRNSWPERPLKLFGPGVDSGTFDYFTEAIVGTAGASRSDYTASEDDAILERGVAANPNALGYFGLSYYEQNRDDLKALAIDNGQGPVMPSLENVKNGTYRPLTRPLFIYVNATKAQNNPVITEFLDFYLRNVADTVTQVGYIAFNPEDYNLLYRNFHKTKVGTVYGGKAQFDLTMRDVLTKRSEY